LLGVACTSCGGGHGGVGLPKAESVQLGGPEDSVIEGALLATVPSGSPLVYRIASPPLHGTVTLHASSGSFTYEPHPDFNGTDSFFYEAITISGAVSNQASVHLAIAPVNDPPTMGPIFDVSNSAYEREVVVPLAVHDVDGDDLTLSARSNDPSVALAAANDETAAIVLTPFAKGTTTVRVTVADAEFAIESEFSVVVNDASKAERVVLDSSRQGIAIRNTSQDAVEFALGHNGFRSFTSVEEIAAYAEALPDRYENEGFERKLWRFLRDSTLHDYPLTKNLWMYDPLVTVNSTGWGFCSNVASAYAQIAAAAGYPARVWELTGHVVAEVSKNGLWAMYDPDLAVFYHTADGRVASVDDLQSDSSLITTPIAPLFPPIDYRAPYTASLASIYTSHENNRVVDEYLQASARFDGRVRLPPEGSLTYPGLWTDPPIGHDGAKAVPVTHYLQALLSVPDGYFGVLRLPWLLHDIQGGGVVRVDGMDFEIGGDALATRLGKLDLPIAELEVLHSDGGVRFVMFVNVIGFQAREENVVQLSSVDAWALSIETVDLAESGALPFSSAAVGLKPKPSDF
jgi:hypothetical protein